MKSVLKHGRQKEVDQLGRIISGSRCTTAITSEADRVATSAGAARDGGAVELKWGVVGVIR